MEKDKVQGLIGMADEKIITISLKKDVVKAPKWKRSSAVFKIIKENLRRHTKSDKIILDKKINERIWARGIENPLAKIRLKIVKQNEGIRAELLQ